jgi:hypothetical protein
LCNRLIHALQPYAEMRAHAADRSICGEGLSLN